MSEWVKEHAWKAKRASNTEYFARETLARVTTDPGPDQSPVWMPDGRRLVFTSQAGGVLGSLFWQAADGSGVAERLTEGTLIQRASSVLPDGSAILFSDPSGLQMFALDERRIRTVMRSPQAGEQGAISPDGRSIAYVVRGTGPTPQVFVSRFSSPDSERTLVSRDGGTHPLWSPDGREIFFIGPDSVLMSAPVAPGPRYASAFPPACSSGRTTRRRVCSSRRVRMTCRQTDGDF